MKITKVTQIGKHTVFYIALMFLKFNVITHQPVRENCAGIRNKACYRSEARLRVSLLYGLKFSVLY